MATARLQKASTNDSVHTKETILAKLDTDLTDSERKSYLNIMLESPETAHLLTIVALEWKIKLLEQQKKILTLKESIRIKNCYIECNKKHQSFDSYKKIEEMQKAIDKDVSNLSDIQSAYEISVTHAEKSLTLFGPLLDEFKQSIDEKWNISPQK